VTQNVEHSNQEQHSSSSSEHSNIVKSQTQVKKTKACFFSSQVLRVVELELLNTLSGKTLKTTTTTTISMIPCCNNSCFLLLDIEDPSAKKRVKKTEVIADSLERGVLGRKDHESKEA
jgi:hypothetical protein